MENIWTRPHRPPRNARRRPVPRGIRSLSPTVVAVSVSLLFGAAGFADAATGGNFILGKVNRESSTASLADSAGTPLALSAPKGKAPLAVSRQVLVKNLNAQYLGGLTATELAVTGGERFTAPGTNAPIGSTPGTVAITGKLPAGTYYVTASATLLIVTGDGFGQCWIGKGASPGTAINTGVAGQAGEFSVAETAAVKVTGGDTLLQECQAGSNNGSLAVDAGIIAIQVLFSHGCRICRPSLTATPASRLTQRGS